MNKTHKKVLNAIYDLIANNTQYEKEDRKLLRKFLSGKNIEIDTSEGKKATIKLGKLFTLTLN